MLDVGLVRTESARTATPFVESLALDLFELVEHRVRLGLLFFDFVILLIQFVLIHGFQCLGHLFRFL